MSSLKLMIFTSSYISAECNKLFVDVALIQLPLNEKCSILHLYSSMSIPEKVKFLLVIGRSIHHNVLLIFKQCLFLSYKKESFYLFAFRILSNNLFFL